jgi:hypothetical protein
MVSCLLLLFEGELESAMSWSLSCEFADVV